MAVINEDEFCHDSSGSSFDWSDAETDAADETAIGQDIKPGTVPLSKAVEQCRAQLANFLSQLCKSVYLSDLVIHCQGGKLPAHRLVLARSNQLGKLMEGDVADIFLMDFDVAEVSRTLQLIYNISIDVKQAELERTKLILELLGFSGFEIIGLKDPKKKKDKLKVKHEKNLSSRKVVSDTKPLVIRKKRVLMANLDSHELSCDICQKSFSALYKLKIHKLTHSSSFPFICAKCGKGFNNKYKMRAHEKKDLCEKKVLEGEGGTTLPIKTVKPIKRYQCNDCTQIFSMVKDLKRHVQSVHKVKEQITCIHCSAICRSQKMLITHLKVVHNDHESGLKCTCGVCGKKFLKLSNLEDHIMRHNSIKHFACMYCPKRCATKQDLDRHLRSHSGEASLVCQFCTRSFVHRKTYTNHIRKHLGQKPYQCKPCNKQFGALNYLKKHQNSHLKKGDMTRIVTARKGSRGGVTVSYIETCTDIAPAPVAQPENKATPIYIPGPHYIQSGSSITQLSQMQVITDYTEVSRLTGYEQPSTVQPANPDCLYSTRDCAKATNAREEELCANLTVPNKTTNTRDVQVAISSGTDKPINSLLSRVERVCVEDTDSRDDGYLLGLFESQPVSIQTTLEKL